jgi:hypothetical protein
MNAGHQTTYTSMETFRVFKDVYAAEELATWLNDRGVPAAVVDTSAPFDPSFANSILSKEWVVRIPPDDFSKAGELLQHFYALRLSAISKDYYLFSFSNEELDNILARPDEWGDLDYVLAQHILASRGLTVSEDQLRAFREKRYLELSKPEEQDAPDFILWGYGLSIVGGLIGSLIGWHLMSSHKILPDGKKVPRFAADTRRHGRRIFWLGLIVTIVFFIARMSGSILSAIRFSN